MFTNQINLIVHEVEQGNGYGKSIPRTDHSLLILKTQDLINCVAILIHNAANCYMIHSDSNTTSGKGGISLQEGINKLKIDNNYPCCVGLVGGLTDEALQHKKKVIENLLPRSQIIIVSPGGTSDSAYLLGDGFMASSMREIKSHLKVDAVNLMHEPTSTLQESNTPSSKSRRPR